MAITPSGKPAWLRLNDHTAYGGRTDKKNYQSRGAINGRTDVTAENICRIASDLAAVARTAPFCSFTATLSDTSPAAPTITNYLAMAGAAPATARVSNGVATFDWLTSYTDDYSVAGDFNIVGATVSLQGSSAGAAVYEIQDINADSLFERLKVYVFDSGGSAVSDPIVKVTIWTGPTA